MLYLSLWCLFYIDLTVTQTGTQIRILYPFFWSMIVKVLALFNLSPWCHLDIKVNYQLTTWTLIIFKFTLCDSFLINYCKNPSFIKIVITMSLRHQIKYLNYRHGLIIELKTIYFKLCLLFIYILWLHLSWWHLLNIGLRFLTMKFSLESYIMYLFLLNDCKNTCFNYHDVT